MKLLRYRGNPILSPSKNWWETRAVFNAGATIFENKITLLYRAIGGDGLSRFGLAKSSDGVNFERYEEPIFEADPRNEYERLGVEDPRITKIDDTYYIVYTAPSVYPAQSYKHGNFAPSIFQAAPWRVRPCLITTKDFKTFERIGLLQEVDSKDAALFPQKFNDEFALLYRVFPGVSIAFSHDLKNWHSPKVIIYPREGFWDDERVGGGPEPIKTEKGWLIFYHGTNRSHVYQLGIVLLDLNDPTKVLFRSPEPILIPEEPFERQGDTPNVVFTCGVVEKDEHFFVYYGGADKVICLATIGKKELLDSI